MKKHYVFRHQSCTNPIVLCLLYLWFQSSIVIWASIHLFGRLTYNCLLHSFLPLLFVLLYSFLLLSLVLQFRWGYFILVFRLLLLGISIYPNCRRCLTLLHHLNIIITTQWYLIILHLWCLLCFLCLMLLRQLHYLLLTFLSVNATHFFNLSLGLFIKVSQTQTNFLAFLLGLLGLFCLFFKVFRVNLPIDGRNHIEDAIKEIKCWITTIFHHFRINYFIVLFLF